MYTTYFFVHLDDLFGEDTHRTTLGRDTLIGCLMRVPHRADVKGKHHDWRTRVRFYFKRAGETTKQTTREN